MFGKIVGRPEWWGLMAWTSSSTDLTIAEAFVTLQLYTTCFVICADYAGDITVGVLALGFCYTERSGVELSGCRGAEVWFNCFTSGWTSS